LKALEEKVAKEGIILAEAQIATLENTQRDDEASGEVETTHPGYLESQVTFYISTLNEVGWIYQQTFIDTYTRLAFTKLYNTKTPITEAYLLNDRVLPFFGRHELPMRRILTDQGTDYCGREKKHDY
jgi:hypothetical protein